MAAVVARLLSTALHGIDPLDPVTFGAVAAVLFVVAMVASYVPARRATRVDPISALRTWSKGSDTVSDPCSDIGHSSRVLHCNRTGV